MLSMALPYWMWYTDHAVCWIRKRKMKPVDGQFLGNNMWCNFSLTKIDGANNNNNNENFHLDPGGGLFRGLGLPHVAPRGGIVTIPGL